MDNLTHSLAGAILGQMGLKKKTGLGMPTLIIAANLPDIDAVATLLGGVEHLALRRGVTHGPIALAILPILLWMAMLGWDRWRPNPKRLPVHKGWLLALAYVGTISHPALDWLNNYGIRLLEPFSSQWFYGDTIFIIDIWIWTALALSLWFSFWRERRGEGNWTRPAWIGFTAICAYIFANGLITERAERMTAAQVEAQHGIQPTLVVANPVPVQFWKRDMQWRDGKVFGYGWFSLPSNVFVHGKVRPHGADKLSLSYIEMRIEEGPAYLFWSRMPVVEVEGEGDTRRLVVYDQRFTHALARDRFMISIPWKGKGDEAFPGR
jgi:inner membrane protein